MITTFGGSCYCNKRLAAARRYTARRTRTGSTWVGSTWAGSTWVSRRRDAAVWCRSTWSPRSTSTARTSPSACSGTTPPLLHLLGRCIQSRSLGGSSDAAVRGTTRPLLPGRRRLVMQSVALLGRLLVPDLDTHHAITGQVRYIVVPRLLLVLLLSGVAWRKRLYRYPAARH